MKVPKVYFNEQSASIEASRFKTGFAKARAVIQELKKRNRPIYWDVLWDCLKDGRLQDTYCEKYAKENYRDWSEVEVRNELRSLFRFMGDFNNSYPFPQKFVTRFEDGSFDINHEAIDEHFREIHTYKFTDKQTKAIQDIINGLEELGISTMAMNRHFYRKDGEVRPILGSLGMFLKNKEK